MAELNKSELTGVKTNTNEDYLKMQNLASLSPEKTMMHLAKYSMLYCWVHKVKHLNQSMVKHILNHSPLQKAASSSWNKIFFQLVGKTKVKEHNLHEVIDVIITVFSLRFYP